MEQPDPSAKEFWTRIAKNPRSNLELLKKAVYWESIVTPRHHRIRLAVSHNPQVDDQVLSLLAHSNYLPLLIAVAEHPNLQEKTCSRLMRKQFRSLRVTLARNPFTPRYVMLRLAKDFHEVRLALAGNPRLDQEAMFLLAENQDSLIRERLIHNPCLCGKALRCYLRDPNLEIRLQLLKHPRIRERHLLILLESKELVLHEAVLQYALQQLPKARAVFEILSQSSEKRLAQLASHHLQRLRLCLETEEREDESCLHHRPGKLAYHSPRSVLNQLAKEDDLSNSFVSDTWDEPIEPTQQEPPKKRTVCLGEIIPSKTDVKELELLATSMKHKLNPYQGITGLDFFRVRQRTPNTATAYQIFMVFQCNERMFDQVVDMVEAEVGRVP